MRKGGPVAVLLLPDRLERFAHREQAQELLRAPAVVAVEPGLMPFSFVVRAPERTLRRTSGRQAKRLLRRLPGRPVAVVVFDVLQWPLARELAERAERCEVQLIRRSPPHHLGRGSAQRPACRHGLEAAASSALAGQVVADLAVAQFAEGPA